MPQTLRSWHRRLIARKHDGSARRSLGGPHTPGEIRELILTMARQNRGWGYTRVQCGAGEPHSTQGSLNPKPSCPCRLGKRPGGETLGSRRDLPDEKDGQDGLLPGCSARLHPPRRDAIASSGALRPPAASSGGPAASCASFWPLARRDIRFGPVDGPATPAQTPGWAADRLISGTAAAASILRPLRNSFKMRKACPENGQILVQEAHPGRKAGHAHNSSRQRLVLAAQYWIGSPCSQSEQLLGPSIPMIHGCPEGPYTRVFIPRIILVKLHLAALGIDNRSDIDSIVHDDRAHPQVLVNQDGRLGYSDPFRDRGRNHTRAATVSSAT